MTPQSLQAILRSLADAGSPVPDAELLARFQAGDETAFTELVKRHGRLVWAVCRNLTGSEAEADDVFQATFLVLVQNAGKVRDGAKLSSWLHSVAYKVCAKARQGAKRRAAREHATAHREGNGSAVPESAWDRALAAVHEEVAKLPETLRVPFVLCCLEGKGVTDAAAQLGWKLGTLSGRLTRAKDAVLAKLDARGLTLGVIAAVGLAVPPAAAVDKAAALVRVGFAVPSSILQLSQGVIGMSMKSVKVLAATVLLACGFGLSVGGGWVATADAQQPAREATGKPAGKAADLEAEVKRLQAEIEKARAVAEAAAQQAKAAAEAEKQARIVAEAEVRRAADAARKGAEVERFLAAELLAQLGGKGPAPEDTATFKTAKHEYNLIQVSDITQTKFRELVERYEAKGWEYCGTTPLVDPKTLVWLFRRPVKAVGATYSVPGAYIAYDGSKYVQVQVKPDALAGSTPIVKPTVVESIRTANIKPDDAKAIEAEIAKLQAKLAGLKANAAKPMVVVFDKTSSPLDPATLASVLAELGKKKFGGGNGFNVSHVNGVTTVYGDKDVIDWATALVKGLAGK